MDSHELYLEMEKLAPYEEATADYRASLSKALKEMKDQVSNLDEDERPDDWATIVGNMHSVMEKIKEIAKDAYKGLPSCAYNKLAFMMEKRVNNELKYSDVAINETFYRMRKIPDRRNGIEYTEMFHVPIIMRRQVSTERFSIPGYPCLYLGNSIYVCWEEMGRPVMNTCWCSRVKPREAFQVLDLRMPSEDDFCTDLNRYLLILHRVV